MLPLALLRFHVLHGGEPRAFFERLGKMVDVAIAERRGDLTDASEIAFEDLLWFVRVHLANTGVGDFTNEDVTVIFNRDILVNESEAIENCGKSAGIISNETLVKQHPWVDDPEEELERIAAEKLKAVEEADQYRAAFAATAGGNKGNEEPPAGGGTPEGGVVNE